MVAPPIQHTCSTGLCPYAFLLHRLAWIELSYKPHCFSSLRLPHHSRSSMRSPHSKCRILFPPP